MLKTFDVHRHYPHNRYAGTAHEATPVPVSQAKLPYHYDVIILFAAFWLIIYFSLCAPGQSYKLPHLFWPIRR